MTASREAVGVLRAVTMVPCANSATFASLARRNADRRPEALL